MIDFCCCIKDLMSLKLRAIFSYPLEVTANKALSPLIFANTSSTFSGVIIINSNSLRFNSSGDGTEGLGGFTNSVSVTTLGGGSTVGRAEHPARNKIIVNPRALTVKRSSICCFLFFICQRCA